MKNKKKYSDIELYSEDIAKVLTIKTGKKLCEFYKLHQFAEWILNRPLMTHEFTQEKLWKELRRAKKFKAAFLKVKKCIDQINEYYNMVKRHNLCLFVYKDTRTNIFDKDKIHFSFNSKMTQKKGKIVIGGNIKPYNFGGYLEKEFKELKPSEQVFLPLGKPIYIKKL